MSKFLLAIVGICIITTTYAQDKKAPAKAEPAKATLPDIRTYIHAAQKDVVRYIKNLKDHSEETDVLTIINDSQRYLDSTSKSREPEDVLLRKHYMGLRNFFLTVNNKTAVSASFIFTDAPYHFCTYNDNATALYIAALKDGDTYSAKNITEKKIASTAFEDCILPSLKSLGEFKENEPKYFGLSIYYGCKDNKETIPNAPMIRAYCLTFVARFADIKKYTEGYITAEDLAENAEIYISNDESPDDFRRVRVIIE